MMSDRMPTRERPVNTHMTATTPPELNTADLEEVIGGARHQDTDRAAMERICNRYDGLVQGHEAVLGAFSSALGSWNDWEPSERANIVKAIGVARRTVDHDIHDRDKWCALK